MTLQERESGRFNGPLFWVPAVGLCLAIGACVSVFLGQDANFDLRNYHLYTGFSGLHDRLGTDLAAAGLQSWMNPLLDIPYAWLALGPFHDYPRCLAAFMGLWYGLLIAVTFALAKTLYADWPRAPKWLAIGMATVLATSGTAVVSQVGTTFNEIQTGTLVLAGVFLLVLSLDRAKDENTPILPLLSAGVLLGLAPGLKLTAAIYCPAACMALLIVLPVRRWFVWLSLVVPGAVWGFLVGGGYWAYRLFVRFGNPAFPFFNGIFRSQWYQQVNFIDSRFFPRDLSQWLFYPLFWMVRPSSLAAEVSFRDGRMGTTLILGLLAGGLLILKRKTRMSHPDSADTIRPMTRVQVYLLAFVAKAYVLWLGTISTFRYLVPVEVACGLSIPLLMMLVQRATTGSSCPKKTWAIVLVAVVAILLPTTRYAQWGRIPYSDPTVSADMKWLHPHTLVVFVGPTISYVVPFAPAKADIEFVGLTDPVMEARGYRLADEAISTIRHHHGPLAIVWSYPSQWRLPSLHDMGVETVAGSCRTIFGSYEKTENGPPTACDGRIEAQKALTSPFWLAAMKHYPEIDIPKPTPGWSYAGFADSLGAAAHGKRYVDPYESLWSIMLRRPKAFDGKIVPDALYIIAPSLKKYVVQAMNQKADLLAEVDGILVLAPGWRTCRVCTALPRQIVSPAT